MQEFKNCNLDARILKILSDWEQERKKDRKENKNQYTADFIYKVQKRSWVETSGGNFEKETIMIDCETFLTLDKIKEGYADDKIIYDIEYWTGNTEKSREILEEVKTSETIDDVLEILKDNKVDLYVDNIVYWKEEWEDVAYFLTRQEAEEYRKYQSHNMREGSRIYVDYAGYDNRGSLAEFLRILDTDDIFE